MKVLFATSARPTHYFPMVPLAWAFRAAGHEVRAAGQPAITGVIARSGIQPVAVGPDRDLLAIRRKLLALPAADEAAPSGYTDDAAGAGALAEMAEAVDAMTDDLVAFGRSWRPDLVIGDPMSPGALVTAGVLGVPSARHLWGPDTLGSAEGAAELPGMPGFLGMFERHGVAVDGDPATWTLDPAPAAMQPPPAGSTLPIRYIPYNGPGAAPPWTETPPERPRVCVTWGLTSNDLGGLTLFLVPQVLEALAGLDVEVVVAATPAQRELLGPVPPSVRVVDNLPVHAVLPRCAAVVHHGGALTTLTAACYGVPQVALTQIPELDLNGERLAPTGAGLHLTGTSIDVPSIRAAVRSVLTGQSFSDNAARLRAQMLAQPTPAEVVARLAG
ncbi:DUF1205 domain-containing protein [Amycolatopsis sp. NBC_00345]|uniref:nucleotide disphospho-sugar-binding domain-containing protein n=1 Tax=Amycolatopsis sp. NBC_00345 TaxID=2975955 RepID=UPI002E25E295